MTNYDTMSAHELVLALVNEVIAMGATVPMKSAHFPAIESALRRKVIEEAQVGTVHLKLNTILCISHCEGRDGVSPLEWEKSKDGPYFIVRKEIP